MMEMYFGSFDNMLSLDEMIDTDLKYSIELGHEVKDGMFNGHGAGPGLASEDWGSWNFNESAQSSLELHSENSLNGSTNLMVNPKNVIPSRRHSPSPSLPTKIKKEINSDEEDDTKSPMMNSVSKLVEVKSEPIDELVEHAIIVEDQVNDEGSEEEDDASEDEEDDDELVQEDEEEADPLEEPRGKVLRRAIAPASLQNGEPPAKKLVRVMTGKPRTMFLMSRNQVNGPQISNAISLARLKSPSENAPAPTINSNGVQMLKPNPNRAKVIKQSEAGKNLPIPSVTSNGVQILKPNPFIVAAKARQQAQQLMNSQARAALMKAQAQSNVAFPKPAYSYSCLIAMALKNSTTGCLPVSEIYAFMCEHFPYFRSAPAGWKNSVRHNLSLNKCFEKIEKFTTGGGNGVRKGCLWTMNPAKISKMDDEVRKSTRKDPTGIRRAMRCPDDLDKLERGELKFGSLHQHVEEDSGDDEGPEEEESDDSGEAQRKVNMFELACILREEVTTRDFLYEYRLIPQSKVCPRCNVDMKLSFANNFYGLFKCSNNHKASAIKGTWFEGSQLGCKEILLSTYCFVRMFTIEQTLAEVVVGGKDAIDPSIIVNWWSNTREVCIDAIEREYDELASLGRIGGQGCKVIVDKMRIGELNNSHRRIKDNVYILVMLEMGTGDYRIEVLEKLDYSVMINHLKQNIEPGTLLLTEEWKGFSRLCHHGFLHKVIADNVKLPADTLWFPHLQKLRQNGVSSLETGHHLYEYLWRREVTRRETDPFVALLQDVAKMHEI
ncbi:Hypothetical protein NTJ_15320 [Nesidiocoris tenuis]|uniref:Fork-head domain-containing protein n=1 Tax=Nesidiocoris tenuis TaxID=355587 RepID=A0ABN7BDT9_9HEMI|nr:Hypothetical protein NTJ_15320 [Nesidiocoris tenuis]